ncbi:MAG: LLM class flavin-dependent oxidoreductase [Chloroflexi bacterium]|nr:LLM class flavin-dependent oxidoreductase [Chloroflexota bacterium]
MKFYAFHLMPYPYLPDDFEQRYITNWVIGPNSLFDPEKGHELYNRYMDELEYAEKVGFDGICVNEHHQNAYGLMPSPNLIACALARRTTKAKIAVLGNCLPLYNPPTRVAEEMAMIDVISGGRLIAGMILGAGPEYFSSGISPAEARGRYYEAHDLIKQAWTKPGPFPFSGKYYNLPYVNTWPRPLQQPHPPIWVPGLGSLETMEFVARNGYVYAGIGQSSFKGRKQNFQLVQEAFERVTGKPAPPEQLSIYVPTYVAETDAQAAAEFESHFRYYQRKLVAMPLSMLVPPGYTSLKSHMHILSVPTRAAGVDDYQQLIDDGYIIVGSPTTVHERLREHLKDLGVGHYIALMQVGTMPHHQVVKNMDLFGREVIPALRDLWQDQPQARATVA